MAWSIEQVVAIAPSPARFAAADAIATPSRWVALGADEAAVWGRCRGSGREPYETAVDHVHLAWRCSCPSRSHPCKHALALLVMWVHGQVPAGVATPGTRAVGRRACPTRGRERAPPGSTGRAAPAESGDEPSPAPEERRDLDGQRDERVARLRAGLVELDRWLVDRLRTGLADPALARYATWDDVAARLVDAQAGALANRVRRLAGVVGTRPDWHEVVLAELGVLHLLAGGRPACARAPRRPRRRGGHGVRLAGAPGRRAGGRPGHRHVGRRRPQRHAGGPHRGAPHVAPGHDVAGAGRWCCRSPPTARRSTRRSSSATRSRPTCTGTRAVRGGCSSARATSVRPLAPPAAPPACDVGDGMRRDRHGARRAAMARPGAGHAAWPRRRSHAGRWLLTDGGGSLAIGARRPRPGHGAGRVGGRSRSRSPSSGRSTGPCRSRSTCPTGCSTSDPAPTCRS